MPELEKEEDILIPFNKLPYLWRGWVVAVGPGIDLLRTTVTYNPGISVGNLVYFKPEKGHYFTFNSVSFIFVRMGDIEIIAST